MRAYFAQQVQLDRCGRCGGLWFDWGELEALLERPLKPELLEGETSRRCAYCRISLLPAVLPGGVPVETCSACRGLYLDAGELSELGGDELPVPEGAKSVPPADPGGSSVEPPRPAEGPAFQEPKGAAQSPRLINSFACVKCGRQFPYAQGNAMRGGLACRTCTPQPGSASPGRTPAPVDELVDLVLEQFLVFRRRGL